MNRLNVARAPDPNGAFAVKGSEWNSLVDALERLTNLQVSPPLTMVDNGAFISIGARPSGVSALYSKISSPWSSNTANIMLGVPCNDEGNDTNSTSLRLNLISPTTATPGQQCYLTTGDVVQYLPYSPKIGSGTNALDGLIVAWDQRGGTNSIGTKLYQVFQMTGTATAGWDWPMAHDLP